MPADEVREKFTAPLLRPVMDMAEIWFEKFYASITFHDPLAAATIFEPELCSYQQGTVEIDTKDMPGRSILRLDGTTAPHQVAVSVNVDRYFEHFFEVVGSA
jgi:purine nucleosidase